MTDVHPVAAVPLAKMPEALVTELDEMDVGAIEVHHAVAQALAEDVPGEDVTSAATVPAHALATADLVARADGTVAGLAVAELVFRFVVGDGLGLERRVADGDRVSRGDVLLTVTGPTGRLLIAERTALNFLCRLSGVATATSAWVEALAGTSARVRDTRKTTPGWRLLEKYAVRCGGGANHRTSLSDQALIKDNHVIAAGGAVEAFEAVRARYPELPVQVEVTTLDQLRAVLDAGADQVLLDNMSTDQMSEAVAMNEGRAALEASGGLTLERAAEVAATGVDFLAVGALTHSAPVLDIAMDLRREPAAP
jgi:nicotinate-nucleotide pyrophosphorylase (carboxylating)